MTEKYLWATEAEGQRYTRPAEKSECGTMHAHLLHLVTVSPLSLLIAHQFIEISTTNKL